MTQEEFNALFMENPNDENVLTEITRLWTENTRLQSDFAEADAERTRLKKEVEDANKRYRERFLSSTPKEEPNKRTGYDSLFREA